MAVKKKVATGRPKAKATRQIAVRRKESAPSGKATSRRLEPDLDLLRRLGRTLPIEPDIPPLAEVGRWFGELAESFERALKYYPDKGDRESEYARLTVRASELLMIAQDAGYSGDWLRLTNKAASAMLQVWEGTVEQFRARHWLDAICNLRRFKPGVVSSPWDPATVSPEPTFELVGANGSKMVLHGVQAYDGQRMLAVSREVCAMLGRDCGGALPQSPGQPRPRMTISDGVVTLDGADWRDLTDDQLKVMTKLYEARGLPVSGADLEKEHSIGRADRIIKRLPDSLRKVIESKRGAGHRLTIFDSRG